MKQSHDQKHPGSGFVFLSEDILTARDHHRKTHNMVHDSHLTVDSCSIKKRSLLKESEMKKKRKNIGEW